MRAKVWKIPLSYLMVLGPQNLNAPRRSLLHHVVRPYLQYEMGQHTNNIIHESFFFLAIIRIINISLLSSKGSLLAMASDASESLNTLELSSNRYVVEEPGSMPFYGAVILFLLFIAHILMELVIKKLDEDDEILSPFPASWNFAVLFYGLGAAYFLGWYIYLNNPG